VAPNAGAVDVDPANPKDDKMQLNHFTALLFIISVLPTQVGRDNVLICVCLFVNRLTKNIWMEFCEIWEN